MSADSHGNTPAAWTTVILVIIGCTIGGAGILAGRPALGLAVGGVIVVVAGIAGKLMAAMGMGAAPSRPGYAEQE